jgi:hypothetical protein
MNKNRVRQLSKSTERVSIETGYKIIAWQRMEGLLIFIVSLIVFSAAEGNWVWFLFWLILPDISILGYLKGPRAGALCYNIAHSIILPAFLTLIAILDRGGMGAYGILIASVWAAHIGLDRALGFGLKFDDDFKHTHLGWIGKK